MNLLPFLKGDAKESPRQEFLYWSDDGDLMAIRVQNWKVAFMEQHTEVDPKTPTGVWQGNFLKLRAPMLYNLRADPFERGPTSQSYGDWFAHQVFLFVPAQAIVAKYIESFKDFPPRAKAASFTVARCDGEAHDSRAEQELMPIQPAEYADHGLALARRRPAACRPVCYSRCPVEICCDACSVGARLPDD